MNNEIAVTTPNRIAAQIELARTMSTASLLPRQYQQNPGNLMWAIQYAEALDVHPMTAITGIHVIDGKPTASAQLIGGLVRRAGHKLRVTSTDTKAVAQVIRQDDPDFTFEVVWTIEKARTANLTGKSVWKNYPAAMLASRAITEVARLACAEALFGVIYTAEELGSNEVDEHGGYIGVEAITPIPARDWFAEAVALTDVDAVRSLYKEAATHGAAADVLASIAAHGKALAEADVVDAEVVKEPVTPVADEVDPFDDFEPTTAAA